MEIEEIIMYGVVWNAILQSIWFLWTIVNHETHKGEADEQKSKKPGKANDFIRGRKVH